VSSSATKQRRRVIIDSDSDEEELTYSEESELIKKICNDPIFNPYLCEGVNEPSRNHQAASSSSPQKAPSTTLSISPLSKESNQVLNATPNIKTQRVLFSSIKVSGAEEKRCSGGGGHMALLSTF